jgi:hypothetical protein
LKQESVDGLLVLEGDRGDFTRDGEDDVEVLDRKEVVLTVGTPRSTRGALALWTVPVPAGVVRDFLMAAAVTLTDVPTESLCAALDNRSHHGLLGLGHSASTTLDEIPFV